MEHHEDKQGDAEVLFCKLRDHFLTLCNEWCCEVRKELVCCPNCNPDQCHHYSMKEVEVDSEVSHDSRHTLSCKSLAPDLHGRLDYLQLPREPTLRKRLAKGGQARVYLAELATPDTQLDIVVKRMMNDVSIQAWVELQVDDIQAMEFKVIGQEEMHPCDQSIIFFTCENRSHTFLSYIMGQEPQHLSHFEVEYIILQVVLLKLDVSRSWQSSKL